MSVVVLIQSKLRSHRIVFVLDTVLYTLTSVD